MKICKIENCQNKHLAKGYCNKHYQQLWQYRKILKRTRANKNEVIDCGDYYELVLYNVRHGEIARTKIDKDDLEKVKQYKWCLGCGYVMTVINKKTIKLHQLILEKKDGLYVDHINHDKVDNRRQNLRHCTNSQNQMNRKNAKGYHWNKRDKRWIAQIKLNQKIIHIGSFTKKQDAISARRKAEKRYFGEFAFKD